MKELYKSPVVSVEELTKKDVLCASTTESDNDIISFFSSFKSGDTHVWTDIPN